MDNEKLFDLMTKMYSEMQEGFKKVNERIDNVDERIDTIEKEVKKTNITIEHDIKPKISALFDGYKQHTDQLERIEKEVSKHDEFILRRIK